MTPQPHAISDVVYEIPADFRPDMRVPARLIADESLLADILRDHSLAQLVNVAALPGVVEAVYGMPDMHEGYGFPVGGVAATELPDGAISPGGIGFDINCGVRLLASTLRASDIAPQLTPLTHELSRSIPTGYGRGSRTPLSPDQMDRVLVEGVPYLVRELGWGFEADLKVIESSGALPHADAGAVSKRARDRGLSQLGSLGGGNHFLEVQSVDAIYDTDAAERLGLVLGQITILIHTGSRGLGHQVCSDYVELMDAAAPRYGYQQPDRQLACVPFSSAEGQQYFAAMCAAAHFGWCNRQAISHRVRAAFKRVFGDGTMSHLWLVYDVAHNTAKVESMAGHTVCVHRKGATRAFGPSSPDIPDAYRGVGQPVFIPGSMGTASFVLVGTDEAVQRSFASACHGAGRALSRTAAKHRVVGHQLRHELEQRGIVIRCPSNSELAEEAPMAYKDVDHVVDVVCRAGIARKVARLKPLGVVKG